jgi:hypothetical protein
VVEAESRLVAATMKSAKPAIERLTTLLKLACGDAAPLGAAADRARVEAMKLARDPGLRAELSSAPAEVDAIRDLLKHASLAA